MRSDKELLELAARAVNLTKDYYGAEFTHSGVFLTPFAELPDLSDPNSANIESKPFSKVVWNPLTDDGAALRLAVKLDMSVIINRVDEYTVVTAGYNGQYTPREHHESDPYAATRRAIVRAAAEIGAAL